MPANITQDVVDLLQIPVDIEEIVCLTGKNEASDRFQIEADLKMASKIRDPPNLQAYFAVVATRNALQDDKAAQSMFDRLEGRAVQRVAVQEDLVVHVKGGAPPKWLPDSINVIDVEVKDVADVRPKQTKG